MTASDIAASPPDSKVPVSCCTLWIGGELGPIASACLASFVRRGHRVSLYCYDAPKNVPQGVGVVDAAAVLPSDRIFRHRDTGSYALFSDLFRYELLRAQAGVWIDCDVYSVRLIVTDAPYIFGWQKRGSVNGAVLRLPRDAPVLDQLLRLFTLKAPVLPWLDRDQTGKFLARRLAGEEFTILDLPWGAAGPDALTHIFWEAGLIDRAAPPDVFYPLPWHQGPLLLKASVDLRQIISPRTLTVHLWHGTIQSHMKYMERGSPLDRLIRQGTLFDERFLG